MEGQALTPAALAYVRARGADPKCSFGDFVALSEPVDDATASFLKGVVSDGIIAPGYEPAALEMLARQEGRRLHRAPGRRRLRAARARERASSSACASTQDRNAHPVTRARPRRRSCAAQLTPEARRDLLLGLVTLKYTQSNSVGYALGGQMIGIGAGQQSRVDCTKLAGAKADLWHLRRHPKVLGLRFQKGVKRQDRINWRVRYIEGDLTRARGAALREALDGPLEPLTADEQRAWIAQLDGVEPRLRRLHPLPRQHRPRPAPRRALHRQPGGSTRDDEVEAACREYGIALVHTKLRLFHH